MSMSTAGPAAPAALDQLLASRRSLYDTGRVPVAGNGFIPVSPTGLSEAAGEFLRSLVQAERAERTIETGFGLGLSTLFLVEGLLRNGGEAVHLVIDPYQTQNWRRAGARTVLDAGVCQFVELIEEDSALALPRLIAEGRRFDVGFVDGGHHFEHAFLDVYYLSRLIRPGGLIVVDDMWMPAVRAAVGYAVANLGVTPVEVPENPATKRFAVLRTPDAAPTRAWDHFVPFWDGHS